MPATFPTFRVREPVIDIEREWPSTDFVSASNRRTSVTRQTVPVRRFRIVYPYLEEAVTAEAPWNAYTEPGAMRAVYAQCTGETGTVTLADPEAIGSNAQVKFAAPLVLTRIAPGIFRAEVELLEVI